MTRVSRSTCGPLSDVVVVSDCNNDVETMEIKGEDDDQAIPDVLCGSSVPSTPLKAVRAATLNWTQM